MTIDSPNTLNTTLFEDGQAAGSIVPGSVRTLINSLAGRFGNPQTSSYTFAATDFGTIIPITNSAGTTATVPLNSTTSFDQYAILAVMQGGNGMVTWTPAAGVTITAPPNKQLITSGPGAISHIWQISLNTWQAFDWGLLSATISPPPQAVAAGYSLLVFDDEFRANSINYNGTYTPGTGSPTQPNWYTANGEVTPLSSSQVFISNGQLSITTDVSGFGLGIGTVPNLITNPSGNSEPGNVVYNTGNGITFTYGYFEASMQFARTGYTGSGDWPSFVVASTFTGGTAAYPHAEFDINEAQPTSPGTSGSPANITSTTHAWTSASTQVNNGPSTAVTTPSGFNYGQFNTFGLLWTPTQLCYYINNQPSVLAGGVNPVNAHSSPTYAAFGAAITASLAANVNGCAIGLGTGLNWTVLFDYVRVWQSN